LLYLHEKYNRVVVRVSPCLHGVESWGPNLNIASDLPCQA
jgi:hypothetical protein